MSQAHGTSMCHVWLQSPGTRTLSNKRHGQQAVTADKMKFSASDVWTIFCFISMWMIWSHSKTENTQTRSHYLLVGWQCDIQIADSNLWNALDGFWFFKEGEAAAGLLTHISNLKTVEEKIMTMF